MKVYGPYWNKTRNHDYFVLYDEVTNKRVTKVYSHYPLDKHEMHEFRCPECGNKAEISYFHYKQDYLDKRIDGPYCSQTCSNKALKRKRLSENHGPWYYFVCPECGNEAQKPYYQYKYHQLDRGHDGPYCSHSCSSKASARNRRKQQ